MDKSFTCSECGNCTFTTNSNLRRHFRKCHPTVDLPSKNNFTCLECNSTFSFHANLVSHVKNFHSDHISSEYKNNVNSSSPKKFKCTNCFGEYLSIFNLNKHCRLKHNFETMPSTPKKFSCKECNAEFSYSYNLKKHERLKHSKDLVAKQLTSISCNLCSSFFLQKVDLFKHWKSEHAINIDTEELELENEDKFLKWKSNIETETKSKYVQNMSSFKSIKGKTVYFQCNRSGYFTSKSKGLRNLKIQGTCKLNSICPARMKVRVLDNGKYVIQFTKTHVGHGQDLGHITLTEKQRLSLATKIASQIPFDEIINDIRESINSDLQYGRIHLLTRKDLHNIAQSFNLLPTAVKHQNITS